MSALEDRLRRFAYEWHETMNSPYAVNMMPLLLEAASDIRSLAAPSLEAENAKLRELVIAQCECVKHDDCNECVHYSEGKCMFPFKSMYRELGVEVD